MAEIEPSDVIRDVLTVRLRALGDDRGRFIETFRKEWFPQREWGRVQANASYSKAGVLRGLHYHLHQVDYWFLVSGRSRVGLCDLRASSPTRLATLTVDLDGREPVGLYIPIGVAHGFVSLTDIALTYLVDDYYDSTDERGVSWSDPDIGLDWGMDSPEMSDRDRANPRLTDIPAGDLPG